MIPAGLVNALVTWADDPDPTTRTGRVAQLVTERDALVATFLSGGKPSRTMTTAGANGKSFGFLQNLSNEDKLSVLTSSLESLGVVCRREQITYGDFSRINR